MAASLDCEREMVFLAVSTPKAKVYFSVDVRLGPYACPPRCVPQGHTSCSGPTEKAAVRPVAVFYAT